MTQSGGRGLAEKAPRLHRRLPYICPGGIFSNQNWHRTLEIQWTPGSLLLSTRCRPYLGVGT